MLWQKGNYIVSKDFDRYKVRLSGTNQVEYFDTLTEAREYIVDQMKNN